MKKEETKKITKKENVKTNKDTSKTKKTTQKEIKKPTDKKSNISKKVVKKQTNKSKENKTKTNKVSKTTPKKKATETIKNIEVENKKEELVENNEEIIELPKKKEIISIIKKVLYNKYTINYILFSIFILYFGTLFFGIKVFGFNLECLKNSFNVFKYPLVLIMFTLILSLLTYFFKVLTNNITISKIIIFVITLILLIVNDIKYTIMSSPVILSDINYLNPSSISMMSLSTSNIGSWIFITILKALILTILFILYLKLSKQFTLKKLNIKKRIISTLLSLIIIILTSILLIKCPKFITKYMYLINKNTLSAKKITEIYTDYGFYEGMLLQEYSNKLLKPDDYKNNDDLKYNENNTKKWEKANIIFLLSETFFDLENIEEIKFDKPLTPFINSLKDNKNSITLNTLVETYGGMSVLSEFEILTASTLSIWPSGYNPFDSYFLQNSNINSPNIIKELNKNNYTTTYLAPWGRDLYHSEEVYKLFNTSRLKYQEDLTGKKKGIYYSDESLINDIYEELITPTENDYKFIMADSAENHFPYPANKFKKSDYEVSVTSSNYTKEETGMLRSLAQGIYDADKTLGMLYQKICELDTPTIIVFFGDHLPYLINKKGENILFKSSYFNTENASLNELRKYTTKSVILSNYDIELDNLEYINLNYLGNYVINNMDLEISPYFKYINTLMKKVPVFNKTTYLKNNTTYSLEDNSEESKLINEYTSIMYYNFYEKTN